MNFDILLQKDITLGEVKNSDAVKFIGELGLEGEAQNKALQNYFNKSVLALAKSQEFVLGTETVIYLENDNTIVVRRQFENKIARLSIDLETATATMSATINEVEKTKVFDESSKIADILKTFNNIVKSFEK